MKVYVDFLSYLGGNSYLSKRAVESSWYFTGAFAPSQSQHPSVPSSWQEILLVQAG